jgi:hypothetical protein
VPTDKPLEVLELAPQVYCGIKSRRALMRKHYHPVPKVRRYANNLLLLVSSKLVLERSTHKLLQCMPVMT